MDEAIATYFRAWNEQDPGRRRRMLAGSVTSDVELLDPTGCWRGVEGLVERIARYQVSAPGAQVATAGGTDAHNGVVRYGWRIIDQDGHLLMEGLDVAERADDGRLRRILMFHGPLPSD